MNRMQTGAPTEASGSNRVERASRLVDPEHRKRAQALIRGKEPSSGRIDREVAWGLAACGLVLDERQRGRRRRHRTPRDCHARDSIRRRSDPSDARRSRPWSPGPPMRAASVETAATGVTVPVCGDQESEEIVEVNSLITKAKRAFGSNARCRGPAPGADDGWRVRRGTARPRVESVDEHAVEAGVDREQEPVGRVEDDRVRAARPDARDSGRIRCW